MLNFFIDTITQGDDARLWLIFLFLIICGLGLPIPEDIPIVISGIMISDGTAHFRNALIVCLSGVLIGDSMIYWAGRRWGVRLIKHRFVSKIIKPNLIRSASIAFRRYGNKIIFIGRFIPGLRAPIFFFVGMRKKPFWLFLTIDGMAAMISVPVWIYVGKIFAENIPALEKAIKELKMGTLFVIVFLILLLMLGRYIRNKFTADFVKNVKKSNKFPQE